jgi:hypothetical protein
MKKVEVEYYRLFLDKRMGDGNLIEKSQNLMLIKKDDDGLMFFESCTDEVKNFFWANDSEVFL